MFTQRTSAKWHCYEELQFLSFERCKSVPPFPRSKKHTAPGHDPRRERVCAGDRGEELAGALGLNEKYCKTNFFLLLFAATL